MAIHRTGSGGAIQEGVLAFLSDKDSEEALSRFADRNRLAVIDFQRGGIQQAIKELAGRTSPSRLVVDVSKSRDIARDVIHLASLCDTDTSLVLIGDSGSIDLYREMMSLGVTDYVVKPLNMENLYNAFNVRSGASRANKLIGVIGTTGGCGATTITAGVGLYLSGMNKRHSCVIDFDTQFATLSLMYNREPNVAIFEALRHPDRVDRLFLDRSTEKINERLSLLSGRVEDDTEGGRFATKYAGLLSHVDPFFRCTICEAPRWLDKACAAVIENAQILIIVTPPDIVGFRNAVELFKVATDEGSGKTRVVVVVNKKGMYRRGEFDAEQFHNVTGASIDYTINFDNTALDALNSGDILSNTRSQLYQGIALLAGDILGETGPTKRKEKGTLAKMFS
ncbi:MAG: hypothetical protein GDA54_04550 [Alphaproteobacteria bacterium GM7ARS4]|nr:hypothetical protein [Alphaproteobacteria bacterium GM7ARS4]